LRADAVMAVRFLIITISMMSFLESLPLDSPLLDWDRDLEIYLFRNLLGDVDLDGLVLWLRFDSLYSGVEFFLVKGLL
jgi:hypothetical protein